MKRLQTWLRRWLGVEQDSQHAATLIQGVRTDLETVIGRTNRNTRTLSAAANSHEARLRAYEQGVPAIAKIRRAIDEKAQRDARKAKAQQDGIAIVPNADQAPSAPEEPISA
jgi:hypothetical protein